MDRIRRVDRIVVSMGLGLPAHLPTTLQHPCTNHPPRQCRLGMQYLKQPTTVLEDDAWIKMRRACIALYKVCGLSRVSASICRDTPPSVADFTFFSFFSFFYGTCAHTQDLLLLENFAVMNYCGAFFSCVAVPGLKGDSSCFHAIDDGRAPQSVGCLCTWTYPDSPTHPSLPFHGHPQPAPRP